MNKARKAEPWKHPAVWPGHLVRMTREWFDGDAVNVATCECGWAACAKATGAGCVAQDDAIEAHWFDVISRAEADAT
ncbi:hypothetical protein [Bradyrhizobium roseum]|uniref:hypothetical protein n=1 Tax=Bradyrhizobium roseum TaxID=3056648 RepID=UPI002606EDE0|nr:hypothetical protein [Bradyrhizobium roseus]WKA31570.1 hypothetical protein QUH67_16045 [Bradyrhizobium roseus]